MWGEGLHTQRGCTRNQPKVKALGLYGTSDAFSGEPNVKRVTNSIPVRALRGKVGMYCWAITPYRYQPERSESAGRAYWAGCWTEHENACRGRLAGPSAACVLSVPGPSDLRRVIGRNYGFLVRRILVDGTGIHLADTLV